MNPSLHTRYQLRPLRQVVVMYAVFVLLLNSARVFATFALAVAIVFSPISDGFIEGLVATGVPISGVVDRGACARQYPDKKGRRLRLENLDVPGRAADCARNRGLYRVIRRLKTQRVRDRLVRAQKSATLLDEPITIFSIPRISAVIGFNECGSPPPRSQSLFSVLVMFVFAVAISFSGLATDGFVSTRRRTSRTPWRMSCFAQRPRRSTRSCFYNQSRAYCLLILLRT